MFWIRNALMDAVCAHCSMRFRSSLSQVGKQEREDVSCSCRFRMPCLLGKGGPGGWRQQPAAETGPAWEEVAACSPSKHLQPHPRAQPRAGHFAQSMALAPAQKPHGVLALSWVSPLGPCRLRSSCSAGEQVPAQHRNKREGFAVPLIVCENAKKEERCHHKQHCMMLGGK